MVYTEVKERNKKKYFYRVKSIRNKNKISKKRIYLGTNLSKEKLSLKEKKADKIFNLSDKRKKENVLKKIKPKIIKVLKKYKVKRAGIFGSYARGEQKKKSDLDILVKIKDKNMSLLRFIHLKHEIEDILGRKVDLVEYDAIKPLIKDRILAEEVRII